MAQYSLRVDARKTMIGLEALTPKGTGRYRINVGYSAPYAMAVHEDLTVPHKNGKAKFLEGPARRLAPEMDRVIFETLKRKKGLKEALTNAGNVLLAASLKEVPVDTGRLRDSHYLEIG